MEKKAVRRDKGQPRWTERDLWVLPWIAEQYTVRFDQLLELLSRQPLGKTQEEGWVGDATVRHWLERWRTAGIVGYASLLVGHPGWAWVTRKGLQTLELEYRLWAPNPGRLQHLYYCNEVRLLIEGQKRPATWRSERALRKEQELRRHGERADHLPDAELVFAEGGAIAIEVELSVKQADRLQSILLNSATNYGAVWYYTLPRIKPHLERAICQFAPHIPSLQERFSLVELEDTWG